MTRAATRVHRPADDHDTAQPDRTAQARNCRRQIATAPAATAIVRAAVGTGADLVLVPGGPTRLADGVGAVLCYADAATPS
jgi:hypothetical protein